MSALRPPPGAAELTEHLQRASAADREARSGVRDLLLAAQLQPHAQRAAPAAGAGFADLLAAAPSVNETAGAMGPPVPGVLSEQQQREIIALFQEDERRSAAGAATDPAWDQRIARAQQHVRDHAAAVGVRLPG